VLPNGKPILIVHIDGRLEKGAGLSDDEASQAFIDLLSRQIPGYVASLRERTEKAEAEAERLRYELSVQILPKSGQRDRLPELRKMANEKAESAYDYGAGDLLQWAVSEIEGLR
jgi:hypothetical protein